jgi:hypothetical protein
MKPFQSLEKNSAGESTRNAQNVVLAKIKNGNTLKKNEEK